MTTTGSKRQPLQFVPIDKFVAAYEPLRYVVDGVIRSASLYTLTAKTGHGKTGFMVTVALAVATGRGDIIGCGVERGLVVYVAAENPDDVRMRFAVAANRFGVDLVQLSEWLIVLDSRAKPEDLAADLARHVGVRDHRLGLAIIDTWAAMFDGTDSSSSVEAGNFMRRLRPLCKLPGAAAVLVACHPVKNAEEGNLIPYGSGATLNEVDGNLTLWKAGNVASLHFQGKLRGPEFEPLPYKFESWEAAPIEDIYGVRVPIPVCEPTTAEAVAERDQALATRNLKVLRAIAVDPEATWRQIMFATGLTNGKVDRALKDLLASKLIVKRSTGPGWRLTPAGKKEAEGCEARG